MLVLLQDYARVQVFAAENLQVAPLALIMVGLVIFTVIVEQLLKRAEEALRFHSTYQAMLNKVYKVKRQSHLVLSDALSVVAVQELMILGLVSFGLLLITQFVPNISENMVSVCLRTWCLGLRLAVRWQIQMFEFAHVWSARVCVCE